ncbi:MAG: hypothetical protein J0H92_04625 [Sphingobacteriales bacterium]|nr:hypothetical protein [Sphingobacteriales bacterium]
MNTRTITLPLCVLLCLLTACAMKTGKSTFFNEKQSGIARVTKSSQLKIASLPPSVSSAVFDYYTRYKGFPFSLDEAIIMPEVRKDFELFKQQGLDWTRLLYRSADSLVFAFSFDVRRYASYMGRSGNPYPGYFEGAYIFLADTQFRLVRIQLDKYSKLEKKYR